jgi:hypothetical protein
MSTTPNLAALEAELNGMIQQGQILEAFEKFYADNCVMQDQGFEPWEGKDLNREREKDFVGKIQDFRDGSMVTGAVGDDVTFSIWNFDYTHAEWGDVKYQQVAVRHWVDGKIVKERFYRG